MRTIFVTGTDTGIGKTQVTAALARLLAGPETRVQIVKAVETGRSHAADGDAEHARLLASGETAREPSAAVPPTAFTLESFEAPLAPLRAAELEGRTFSLETLAAKLEALPVCDWRIIEGAGGLAVPLTADGLDWTDFATLVEADAPFLVVVPDRLGAINQARLAHAYAASRGLNPLLWLNACAPVDPAVADSNVAGLTALGLPPFARQFHGEPLPENASAVRAALTAPRPFSDPSAPPHPASADIPARCAQSLAERSTRGLRRSLRVTETSGQALNLADNDYLDLAHDEAVVAASVQAAQNEGVSASASPLVTGWRPSHQTLTEALCAWHGFPHGLLWSSGYAANAGVLGVLPRRGDLVLADRLIHHSMIAGLTRGEARLKRYPHLRLDLLEAALEAAEGRTVIVVTESVFSMDGDYPDMARLAELKRKFGFFWVLDEAHALGWYGPEGSGLARAAGVEDQVDVLVGTLGKALASGGAYTLFRNEAVRDQVMNHAGELIYSTALPPPAVRAAGAALERMRGLASRQAEWHSLSRRFRARLRGAGWEVPEGDSPIVPVRVGDAGLTLALAETLRKAGVVAGAVRPPTVPEGTSRLRFSLKRTLSEDAITKVLEAMDLGRKQFR